MDRFNAGTAKPCSVYKHKHGSESHATIFIVDPSATLQTYIQDQLQNGLTHQQVIAALLGSGWSMDQLKQYAPYLFYSQAQPPLPVETGAVPLTSGVVAEPASSVQTEVSILPDVVSAQQTLVGQFDQTARPKSIRRWQRIIPMAVLAVLLVASGAFLLTKLNSTSFTDFNDPNFSMKIPNNWARDAGYKPGSMIVLYYSPEGASNNGEAAAKFTAYIAIEFDRIEDQIRYLSDSKAQYDVVSNESFDVGDVHYHLVEVVSKLPSDDEQTHTLYVNATRGEFMINADIVSKESEWNLHADQAEKILRSIVPGCSKFVAKKELFSEVSKLCSQ